MILYLDSSAIVKRYVSETHSAEVRALMDEFPDDAGLQGAATQAIAAMGEWEALINQPKHQTYEDEDAWETMLAGQLRYLMDVIDRSGAPVTDGAMTRLADLRAEWSNRRRFQLTRWMTRPWTAPRSSRSPRPRPAT